MRQLWLSRPGDGSDRAWLIFSLVSAVLVWLAWGGLDFARAQEPKADAAAKDARRPRKRAAEAERPPRQPAAPAAAEGATPPAAAQHAPVGDLTRPGRSAGCCCCFRSTSAPW